jgi:hypothetical protein
MDPVRNFYHILTNNNGDSLIELSEADSAFDTEDYPDGDYRIFVEAYDEYGNSVLDSMDVRFRNGNYISNSPFAIPNEIQLEQNHPNPFNSSTVIRYTIPHSCEVTLTVYDVLGRKVRVLVDGFQAVGQHSGVFDGEELSSGIYFYQLKAGEIVATKKMVYLR